MSKIVVFDLDNCVSDDLWRRKFISKSDADPYAKYHSQAWFDRIGVIAKELIVDCDQRGDDIWFFTARPALYMPMTTHWLNSNGVDYRGLSMRRVGDLRSSPEIKSEFLNNLLDYYRTSSQDVIAYDDRRDVVDMYSAFGVDAWVLNIEAGYHGR